MRDLFFYISKAIEQSGVKSERKLCEMMGLSHNAITHYRNGALPTDETMIRLAQIAQVDPYIALLDLNTWRNDGPVKLAYKKILEKLTVCLLVLIIATASAHPAFASVSSSLVTDNVAYMERYCILCQIIYCVSYL